MEQKNDGFQTADYLHNLSIIIFYESLLILIVF